MEFSRIQAVVSDMDGVLWRGKDVLPGVAEFFAFLREQSIPFVLATNNAGKHPQEYVERMAQIGVPDMTTNQIITSGTVTASWLQRRFPDGARLYVIGNPGLRRVLQEAGFSLVEDNVDAVVVGIDFAFNYDMARHATLLIRNHGALFIGTNPDVTFPAPEGLVPGAGSLIAMIQIASGVDPIIMGKPQPAMFEVALEQLGAAPAHTLMIGDRLDTDIEGAIRAGMCTALLRSGVWDGADYGDSTPNFVGDDLEALFRAWMQAVGA